MSDDIQNLLRAIASGTQAQENKHDLIFIAAAERIDRLVSVLEYVADMTYCGRDGEWHFKKNYKPELVLDAIT